MAVGSRHPDLAAWLRSRRAPQHPQLARKERRREGEEEGEAEGEEEGEEEEEGVAPLLKF